MPIPEIQGREVLIRVHAAGVNPVDTYIRSGTYSRRPLLPYIPGLDSAGIVERVGPEVTKFKVNKSLMTSSREHHDSIFIGWRSRFHRQHNNRHLC